MIDTASRDPASYMKEFGNGLYFGAIALDIALGLVGAALIVLVVANYRARRRANAASCAAGTSASLGVAAATFGCPGCPMPIAGSFGAAFFANTLPLMGLEFKILSLVVSVAVLAWTVRRLANVDLAGAPSVPQRSLNPA